MRQRYCTVRMQYFGIHCDNSPFDFKLTEVGLNGRMDEVLG